MDALEIVTAYGAAWNEPDEKACSRDTMCPERNTGRECHGREERPHHHEPV